MGNTVRHSIDAHDSQISALAVNSMGTLIASGSEKGTIIRIFSAEDGSTLQELRRGTGKASINDLVFHPNLNLLACSSNKTSIHLFEIKESIQKCLKSKEYGFCKRKSTKENIRLFDNKKSNFKFLNFLSGFFNSEWAGTKIKVTEGNKICGFDAKNNALAIVTKGKIYYIDIPKRSCRTLEEAHIIKL